MSNFPPLAFSKDTIVIVGSFGSGKSEVAVNLARHLASASSVPVTIADLDIVNPYFRSREAAKELALCGVRSLIPEGEWADADLPIIVPEIKGALGQHEGVLILDVGGDDLGATVLKSLGDAFVPDAYDLWLTLNKNRPFTADVNGAMTMIRQIEAASTLKFTGIISNAHLIDDTTAEVVLDGLKLAREVSARSELPIVFVTGIERALAELKKGDVEFPVLPINRSLLKPWERKSST